MDSAVVVLLAVLAFLPKPTQDPQSDTVTDQRMKERQVFLEEKMSELWEEIEWRRALEEVPLFWILQHWLFWAAEAAVLCWLLWQRQKVCRRRRQRGSCRAQKEEELSLSALQEVSPMGQTLKKLVQDLLEVCQVLSRDTFMPELHLATGKQGTMESFRDLGHHIIYQLVLCLRPPPRHSFHLQLPDDSMDAAERRCHIRVLLECSCSRTMANPFCLAHPTYAHQQVPILRTLCAGSNLEVEKVAAWVQRLVQSAWKRLPQWHHWQLRVLPSSRSCKFLVIGPSRRQSCIELFFALQQGSSDNFLIPA